MTTGLDGRSTAGSHGPRPAGAPGRRVPNDVIVRAGRLWTAMAPSVSEEPRRTGLHELPVGRTAPPTATSPPLPTVEASAEGAGPGSRPPLPAARCHRGFSRRRRGRRLTSGVRTHASVGGRRRPGIRHIRGGAGRRRVRGTVRPRRARPGPVLVEQVRTRAGEQTEGGRMAVGRRRGAPREGGNPSRRPQGIGGPGGLPRHLVRRRRGTRPLQATGQAP